MVSSARVITGLVTSSFRQSAHGVRRRLEIDGEQDGKLARREGPARRRCTSVKVEIVQQS